MNLRPVEPPMQTTKPTFLDWVARSGLVEPRRLADYLAGRSTPLPNDPRSAAGELVRAGLLTRFQADQLARGRFQGFVIRDKYKVLERLGAGGMGTVYLCEHMKLRRPVAVKVMAGRKLKEPENLERFHREARAAALLDDPNVVRVYDVEEDDRLPITVMEYIDGSDLEALVRRHGPLPPKRAAHYIAQAALGLQHAHDVGLVHRDVKPGNLMLDRQGTVKVLDLGLARPACDPADTPAGEDGRAIIGTADYLSPEQILNSNYVDVRADIYSLGCTLHFLLAGEAPFGSASITQKLLWHQLKPLPPLPQVPPAM